MLPPRCMLQCSTHSRLGPPCFSALCHLCGRQQCCFCQAAGGEGREGEAEVDHQWSSLAILTSSLRTEAERMKNTVLAKKLEATQEELMKTQIKYQKEIEKLEKENKELRKQILLKAGQKMANKSIKKSLIDMYR